MSFTILIFCSSIIFSSSFCLWLARKANMQTIQGVSIALFSALGTLSLMLALGKWLMRMTPVVAIAASAASVLLFCTIFLVFRFYRDPERRIPNEKNIIVSPADGRVLYIREVSKGTVPNAIKGRTNIKLTELLKTDILKDDTVLIGIMMTLLDVHVNRAPIAGRILLNQHYSGKFLSLKDNASITENERNTIVLSSGSKLVAMVQIASKQVRKIITYISEGDDVQMGQRVGAILLGSQVDLIVPKQNISILVDEGQQIYAGKTIVARFENIN